MQKPIPQENASAIRESDGITLHSQDEICLAFKLFFQRYPECYVDQEAPIMEGTLVPSEYYEYIPLNSINANDFQPYSNLIFQYNQILQSREGTAAIENGLLTLLQGRLSRRMIRRITRAITGFGGQDSIDQSVAALTVGMEEYERKLREHESDWVEQILDLGNRDPERTISFTICTPFNFMHSYAKILLRRSENGYKIRCFGYNQQTSQWSEDTALEGLIADYIAWKPILEEQEIIEAVSD